MTDKELRKYKKDIKTTLLNGLNKMVTESQSIIKDWKLNAVPLGVFEEIKNSAIINFEDEKVIQDAKELGFDLSKPEVISMYKLINSAILDVYYSCVNAAGIMNVNYVTIEILKKSINTYVENCVNNIKIEEPKTE
jgi:hypothetical protein